MPFLPETEPTQATFEVPALHSGSASSLALGFRDLLQMCTPAALTSGQPGNSRGQNLKDSTDSDRQNQGGRTWLQSKKRTSHCFIDPETTQLKESCRAETLPKASALQYGFWVGHYGGKMDEKLPLMLRGDCAPAATCTCMQLLFCCARHRNPGPCKDLKAVCRGAQALSEAWKLKAACTNIKDPKQCPTRSQSASSCSAANGVDNST